MTSSLGASSMGRPLEQDVSGLTTLTVDRPSKEGLLA